jgi:hypothetical protein
MKVKIKKFAVEMNVKNAGIEFQVHSNKDEFLGDCYITKKGLIWCKGKTSKANGKSISWEDFIDQMENS